jgi:hypothetical protein
MKAALKKKWIAALRSGKYKQGDSALRLESEGESQFCCLGVLADVAGLRWHAKGPQGEREFWLGSFKRDTCDTMLPPLFAAEHDLGHPNATKSIQLDLASMNDTGRTFKEIANWIEKNL